MVAGILTIGNELVSGDVPDTNAAWLAKRLEPLGVRVAIAASVPDDEALIVDFVRRERVRLDHLLVTGGLGGTPDDITREALAAAFEVAQEVLPALRDELQARFRGSAEYAGRWAALPVGSEPLENPLGGAPGFRLENVWVMPGLPREMEAMFDRYAHVFDGGRPIRSWRRRFRTGESRIADLLVEATRRWPQVDVGSYPSFHVTGPQVEIVLKSADASALDEATAWLAPRLAER